MTSFHRARRLGPFSSRKLDLFCPFLTRRLWSLCWPESFHQVVRSCSSLDGLLSKLGYPLPVRVEIACLYGGPSMVRDRMIFLYSTTSTYLRWTCGHLVLLYDEPIAAGMATPLVPLRRRSAAVWIASVVGALRIGSVAARLHFRPFH